MKKKLNGLDWIEIVTMILYIVMLITEIIQFVRTKNWQYVITGIWVINSINLFNMYINQRDWGDERVGWRDQMIEVLFKELKKRTDDICEAYTRLDKALTFINNESLYDDVKNINKLRNILTGVDKDDN